MPTFSLTSQYDNGYIEVYADAAGTTFLLAATDSRAHQTHYLRLTPGEVREYYTDIQAFLVYARTLITPLGPTESARSRALPAAQVTRIDDRTLRTTP